MSKDGIGTLNAHGCIRREGEYYYAPHRNLWGIWQWHNFEIAKGGYGDFVKNCATKKEAREEVYRLNGWSIKENGIS